MPIFLLLAETTWTWQFAAKQLESWVHMVAVEEVLIDRARSAFLVHWFGMHLPLKGLSLKVYIDNLQELSNRYLVAAKSAKGEITGLNLTEPLAGIAGQVAGTIVSPVGLLLKIEMGLRKSATWVQVLLGVLLTLMGAPIFWSGEVSGLVLGLGLPLGFLGGIGLGAVQEETTGVVIEFLGALAKLLNSARVFLEIIMGPPEKIKNPLLTRIMNLIQGFAALMPQVLGFAAILVTRISPLLFTLFRDFQVFQAFKELMDPVGETLKRIKKDLVTRVEALDPIGVLFNIIGVVTDSILKALDLFFTRFLDFLDNASTLFKAIFKHLKGESGDEKKKIPGTGFLGFFETVAGWLKDAVHKHPLIVSFQAITLIQEALAKLKGTVSITPHFAWIAFHETLVEPSADDSDSKFPVPDITTPGGALDYYALRSLLAGKLPDDVDTIVPRAKALKLEVWPHGPGPLSPLAEKHLQEFRHPQSVFGLERKNLVASLGRTPEAMLQEQQKLRDLISVVVGRILPPELRGYMDDLVSGLKKLDDAVLGRKDKTKKLQDLDYPVRHIPDNGELRPIVRRLVIRSQGGDKLKIQDFEQRIRKALLAQRYLAPDPV
jgi:hypothetical protein